MEQVIYSVFVWEASVSHIYEGIFFLLKIVV